MNWFPEHTAATVWIVLFLAAARTGYRFGRYGGSPVRLAADYAIILVVALAAWSGALG